MTDRKASRSPHGLFVIEGECWRPRAFGYLDLSEVHSNYLVEDVATVDERLAGRGVRLRALIDMAGPDYGTAWLTIESLEGFRACVPLGETTRTAIVIFEKDGKPLAIADGGPARLIVPYRSGDAADVRGLSRLFISRQPTRPEAAGKGRGRNSARR